jgi:hypothetical protein
MAANAASFAAAAALLAALASGAPAAPQTQPAPSRAAIDVQSLGPQVGKRVPDFALRDQNGVLRTLPSIVGPKGAILVFFRSADW